MARNEAMHSQRHRFRKPKNVWAWRALKNSLVATLLFYWQTTERNVDSVKVTPGQLCLESKQLMSQVPSFPFTSCWKAGVFRVGWGVSAVLQLWKQRGDRKCVLKTFNVTFILPGSLGLQAPTTFKSPLRSLIAHLSNVTKTVSTDTDWQVNSLLRIYVEW